jgi:hypothetical protein
MDMRASWQKIFNGIVVFTYKLIIPVKLSHPFRTKLRHLVT